MKKARMGGKPLVRAQRRYHHPFREPPASHYPYVIMKARADKFFRKELGKA